MISDVCVCVSCRYLDAGRDIVASLQYGTQCPCGYCHISDVESHKKEDHMESFFLAETVRICSTVIKYVLFAFIFGLITGHYQYMRVDLFC